MPVNTKSMFSMLLTYMDKLDKDEIDVYKANVLSKLMREARGFLEYELKRAALMTHPDFKLEHRNLELKVFDSLPEESPILKEKTNNISC